MDVAAVTAVIGLEGWPVSSAFATYSGTYKEMIGYVPPKVEARMHVTGAIDPQMVALQEQMRAMAMHPKCLEEKTVQLIIFAILLMDLNDAAYQHGIAARRAGVSWEELQSAVNICFMFRGLPAANQGGDLLRRVAEYEAQNPLPK